MIPGRRDQNVAATGLQNLVPEFHRRPLPDSPGHMTEPLNRMLTGDFRHSRGEALYRTRTDDPFLTMEVLYQLS